MEEAFMNVVGPYLTESTRAYWQAEIRAVSGKKIIGSIPYHSLSYPLDFGERELIRPGAFSNSLRSGQNIVSLWSHDANKPLGSTKGGTLKLRDTPTSLEIELTPGNNTWGQDVLEAVRRGDVTGISFGFSVVKETYNKDGVRELIDVNLNEVSPCVFPAYPESSVSVRQKPKTSTYKEKDMTNITQYWKHGNFEDDAEMLRAVAKAGDVRELQDVKGVVDTRLMRSTGLNELIASEGGFLANQGFSDKALYDPKGSLLLPYCFRDKVEDNVSGMFFPRVSEDSRVDGSQLGGAVVYWIREGETGSYAPPTGGIGGLGLTFQKLVALCPITDELLESRLLPKFLSNVYARSTRYEIDKQIVSGSGVGGEFLGILNSPCVEVMTPDVSQMVDTVELENLASMWSRLWPASQRTAVWMVSPSAYAEFIGINLLNSAPALFSFPVGDWPHFMGRPVIPVESLPKLGNKGDVILADLQEYLVIEKAIREQTSMHVLFSQDESVYKMTYRCAGQPTWSQSVTPMNQAGTEKLSPFVVLGERA